MQTESRRSNEDRSATTRAALLGAARKIFAEKGFAAAGTPEIVAAAAVTRGALYHHFADKTDLFRAVVAAEQAAVAAAIETAAPAEMDPVAALIAGGEAFLDAMDEPGRRRILLREAPAALGEEARTIDRDHAGRTLAEGVSAAIAAGALPPLPARALTDLLDAMFDRAALAAGEGAPTGDYRRAIAGVIRGLAAAARDGPGSNIGE